MLKDQRFQSLSNNKKRHQTPLEHVRTKRKSTGLIDEILQAKLNAKFSEATLEDIKPTKEDALLSSNRPKIIVSNASITSS